MQLSPDRSAELYAAVGFLVIGLSHIAQPQAWVTFFAHLHSRGTVGVFAEGFLYLATGSVIVAFHNVWSGLPMVLTIIGWSMVFKATTRFVFPALGLRMLQTVPPDKAWLYRAGGAFAIVLSAFCGYLAFRPPA